MGSILTSISPTLTPYSRLLLTWGLGSSEDNMSLYTSPQIYSSLCWLSACLPKIYMGKDRLLCTKCCLKEVSAEFLVLGQVSCCLALGLWQGSLGPVTKRIYKKGFSLSSHIIKDNILIRLLPLNCGALHSYPGPAALNRPSAFVRLGQAGKMKPHWRYREVNFIRKECAHVMVCYKTTMVGCSGDWLLWCCEQSALNSGSLLGFKRPHGELKLSESNLGAGNFDWLIILLLLK